MIRAIDFAGNQVLDSAMLANRISIKPSGPFDPGQISFSRDLILSVYRDKGYAEVQVFTSTSSEVSGWVDVHFAIKEGPLYRIGAITVEGNHELTAALIQRDLDVRTGEPFSQAKIYEGNKMLFLSGYFETVDIQYSSAAAHAMDMRVRVKERPTRYLKGGVGYGTQTKERVSLGYEDRNFFGNERQLDVKAVESGFITNPRKYRTTIVQANLAQAHFLGSSYAGQTGLSEEWDYREPYDSRTTAWRSSLGRKFGQSITASLRYRFQGTHLMRIDPTAAATTPAFSNVSALAPTFTYDNTNDPFLPTVGWRVTSLLEKAFTFGLGDINFQRFEARAGRFETFFGSLTGFAGLQAGIVRPDNPNDSIPLYERYTLGGANTVRGYEEREIGPRDAEGSPIGGNAFLVGNFEVRQRLYRKLYGVWFLDGGQLYEQFPGDAWPTIHADSLSDFDFGTGPGLRFNTPVGAVRLEVGYKLNPPDPDGFFQRTSVHFSLGEVF